MTTDESKLEQLRKLNERRTARALQVQLLGTMNVPTKSEDRIRQDAQYRLAHDVWLKAEGEYRAFFDSLPAEELAEIAYNDLTPVTSKP